MDRFSLDFYKDRDQKTRMPNGSVILRPSEFDWQYYQPDDTVIVTVKYSSKETFSYQLMRSYSSIQGIQNPEHAILTLYTIETKKPSVFAIFASDIL